MNSILHLVRSKFFVILIAMLVLTGYAEVWRGTCSLESETAACVGEETSHSPSDADHGNDAACQCLCHQCFVNEQPTARLAPSLLSVISLVLERADIPPESVPLGIDYPPQLA